MLPVLHLSLSSIIVSLRYLDMGHSYATTDAWGPDVCNAIILRVGGRGMSANDHFYYQLLNQTFQRKKASLKLLKSNSSCWEISCVCSEFTFKKNNENIIVVEFAYNLLLKLNKNAFTTTYKDFRFSK